MQYHATIIILLACAGPYVSCVMFAAQRAPHSGEYTVVGAWAAFGDAASSACVDGAVECDRCVGGGRGGGVGVSAGAVVVFVVFVFIICDL